MSHSLSARVGLALAGLALLTLLLPAASLADPLDDSVRRVALQLQCPVCEGQNAADSPSGLAADMRAVVRTRLTQGATDQQILDEFVASYGDGILTEPPKRGISLGVWLGPLLGVVAGAAVLIVLVRAWRQLPSARATAAPGVVDAEAADEYHRFREEFGR
jgi:cytochrome c-type biogenesis protein CcmH